MTERRESGSDLAPSEPNQAGIDQLVVDREAHLLQSSLRRTRAPWLTLAAGLLMVFVGGPIAWVTLGSLISSATAVPVLTQLANALFGVEGSGEGGGWILKLIIFAVALVMLGLGLITSVASTSVLIRRGVRHTVEGTKRAAALAQERNVKGKVQAGAVKITDATQTAAANLRDSEATERARGTLASGTKALRKGSLRLGDALRNRYEETVSGRREPGRQAPRALPKQPEQLPPPSANERRGEVDAEVVHPRNPQEFRDP